jgi:hypothetical protein
LSLKETAEESASGNQSATTRGTATGGTAEAVFSRDNWPTLKDRWIKFVNMARQMTGKRQAQDAVEITI